MIGKFKVGDVVRWISQSRGSAMEKVGKIVHVVDAGKPFPAQQYTVTNPGKPRDHESYVVEVKEKGKRRGMERKPKYFWPKVLHLRKSRAKA